MLFSLFLGSRIKYQFCILLGMIFAASLFLFS